MTPLVTPTINLNGNSASDLVEKLRVVLEALRVTERAMGNASDVTHGRNFQTLSNGGDVRIQADHAWRERWMQIDQMRQDIEKLAIAIQEQTR